MTLTITPWLPSDHGNHEAFIERCGRVSHRSEKKITATSHLNFMKRVVMLRRDHSVAEHAAFRVRTNTELASDARLLRLLKDNPFVRWIDESGGRRTLLVNGRHAVEMVEKLPADRSTLEHGILRALEKFLPTITEGVFGTLRSGFYPISAEPAHVYYPGAHPDLTVATYFVKGVSRVTEVQDVRHRLRNYTVMSGRTVDVRDQPFVFPTGDPTVIEKDFVKLARECYGRLVDELKMKPEDARYFLPLGFSTEMVVTATLSVWKLWLSLRLGRGAQHEIREEAALIRDDLKTRFPELMEGV